MARIQHGVLLALADPWLRAALQRALAGGGLGVRTAGDAYTAWALFLEGPDAHRMVVADLDLPGLSGPRLIRRLRGVRPWLPALLLCDELSDRLDGALAEEGIAAARLPAPLAHLARRIEMAAPAPFERRDAPLQAVG
jgi:DNA-binding response OmpR family regulator